MDSVEWKCHGVCLEKRALEVSSQLYLAESDFFNAD